MSEPTPARPAVELTGSELLLVSSALDWLTSSFDDESVRLTTGWPAVGVAWLSSVLSGSADPGRRETGPARAVANAIREGLAAQGFAPPLESAAGHTIRLCCRRSAGGPEPRLAIDVIGAERADDPVVHVHVRVGVHDPGIEGTLAAVTDAPAGRTQPVTAETFLLDLIPDDPAPEWVRIGPGERQSGPRALLRDIAESATPWWKARDTQETLVERLGAERHRAPAGDRRLATGRGLARDPAGAEAALRRHVHALPSLPWPADHYTATFLARFGDRFGLDLEIARPEPVPSAGARTPITVHSGDGWRFDLDTNRVTVLVAALGAALDEDDFEFEMVIAPSKAQARDVRASLLSTLA